MRRGTAAVIVQYLFTSMALGELHGAARSRKAYARAESNLSKIILIASERGPPAGAFYLRYTYTGTPPSRAIATYWSSRSRPWWPAKNLSHSARVSSASSDEEIEGIVRSAAPPPAAPPAAAPLPPSCVAAHQSAVPSLSSSGICSC